MQSDLACGIRTRGRGKGHSQRELELGDVVGADEEGGLLLDHLSGGDGDGGGRKGRDGGPKWGGGFYGWASEMRGNAVLSESSMYV